MTTDGTQAIDAVRGRETGSIIVILNPYSGRGRGGRIKAQLQTALAKAGITYDLVETTRQGEAIDLAQKAHTDGYGTIIAVGGDGTVSEVANGLVQASAAEKSVGKLAIISVGSGNDFAHAWHISSNLDEAALAIANGVTRACDLGHVTIQAKGKTIERYFNNNFGTGLDAQVTLESLQIKRLQGVMLYGTAALRALWKLKTPIVDLQWEAADGQSHERSGPISLVSVGNTPRSGGGFHLTPGAQMDDGLLDLGIADALSRWQLLQLLPKALQGNHVDHPGFTLLQFRTLRLKTNDPLPVEMDGEVITEHAEQIDISVLPARLEMIV